MKLLSLVFALTMSTASLAAYKCTLLVPFPPGGATDIMSRTLQIGNPDIEVDYKPGAFGSVAINQMNKTSNTFILSPAIMYSAKNPIKNLDIELNRIVFAMPIKILTKKYINLEDIADSPIKIGVSCKGCPFEGLALEIKDKNQNVSLIVTGGDAKALPMIMNGDLDIYLTTGVIADNWTNNFKDIKVIGEIPFNKTLKIKDIELENLAHSGIFTKTSLSNEEKNSINNCINKSVTSEEFTNQVKKTNLPYVSLSQTESQQILSKYIAFMRKHGL